MNIRIKQAANIIAHGGVIAYPTETVWGFGCDPFDREAVDQILAIKQRRPEKGLILVAGSIEQALPLIHGLKHRQKILDSWPGPTTWIVPASAHIPTWITGQHKSVAIRVSNHPIVRDLCLEAKSLLVSTSCNRAGKPVVRSALQARVQFGNQINYILPGKTAANHQPSKIFDAVTLHRHR